MMENLNKQRLLSHIVKFTTQNELILVVIVETGTHHLNFSITTVKEKD